MGNFIVLISITELRGWEFGFGKSFLSLVIGSDRCATHKEVSAIQNHNSFSYSSNASTIMAHTNLYSSDPAARAIENSILTPLVIASLSPPRRSWLLTICKRLRRNGEVATPQAMAAFHKLPTIGPS